MEKAACNTISIPNPSVKNKKFVEKCRMGRQKTGAASAAPAEI
jgi:hypothetical protein